MKKIVIVSGLISGAIVSTLMGISMAFYSKNANMDHSMVMGYAMMLLAFSLIFVAIKIYRDKENGGVITFGKGFTIGLLISLIASTIYVATWAVEYKYAFPDFMEKYSSNIIDKARAASKIVTDKQIAKMIDSAKTSGADQTYIDKQAEEIREKANAKIDKQMEEMNQMGEMYKNPVYFTLFTFAEIFPVGLLVSLIAALILKRKNKTPQVAFDSV